MFVNPRVTFDEFVNTGTTDLAYKACLLFAEWDQLTGNLLLLHGPPGVGKTHLLQAIANHVQSYFPTRKIVFTTAENFIDELITAIRQQNTETFRAKYRKVDYLLFDNLHIVDNKESTQEELFHTFNYILHGGGRIALGSVYSPDSFSRLHSLITSRLRQALMIEIGYPKRSDLYLIISKKFNTAEPKIPNKLLNLICDISEGDIRKAEGLARKTLFVYAQKELFPSPDEIKQWGGINNKAHNSVVGNEIDDTKTTILFVAADPTDASRLRLGQESREIQEQLQLSMQRDKFTIHQVMSARPEDLSQALLNTKPIVVHFSGHSSSSGELCFEDRSGQMQPVSPDALAALFDMFSSHVKYVVLNACFSEIQAEAIAKYTDYVVGMRQEIGDKAAISFSIGLYQALSAGRTFEDSYKLGCIQIRLQGYTEYLIPTLIKKKEVS